MYSGFTFALAPALAFQDSCVVVYAAHNNLVWVKIDVCPFKLGRVGTDVCSQLPDAIDEVVESALLRVIVMLLVIRSYRVCHAAALGMLRHGFQDICVVINMD